jgi:hypothetical protein
VGPRADMVAVVKRRIPIPAGWATGWKIGVLGFDCRRGVGNFSLRHRVQNCSGAHPASYPMGTRVSFPVVKVAGA